MIQIRRDMADADLGEPITARCIASKWCLRAKMSAADIARAAAFKEWSERLDDALRAVSIFKTACVDPRFTAPSDSLTTGTTGSPAITVAELGTLWDGPSAKVQRLMDDVKSGLAHIGHVRNLAIAASTPSINRLPVELLKIIFCYAAEYDGDGPFLETYGPKPVSPQLRSSLTNVCRLWRTVCLDTGRLWRRIDFIRWGPMASDHRAEIHIARASSFGLNVHLQGAVPEFLRNVSLVIPFISRWRHISYDGDMDKFQAFLDPQIESGTFGHDLVSLRLVPPRAATDPLFMDRLWRSLHRLDELDVTRILPPFTRPSFSHLFCGLLHLRIFGIVFSHPRRAQSGDIQTILEQCRNLTSFSVDSCVFKAFDGSDRFPDVERPVVMSVLSTLIILNASSDVISECLRRMSAPKLIRLKMDGIGAQRSQQEIFTFLDRSNCKVECLTWDGHWWGGQHDGVLTKLFPKLSSLRSLTFQEADIGDEDIQLLFSVRGIGQVLCPSLQEIRFQNCVFQCSVELLLRLVRLRNSSTLFTPLHEMSVEKCSFDNLNAMEFGDFIYTEWYIRRNVEKVVWDWNHETYIDGKCDRRVSRFPPSSLTQVH
jgi:hypothetical protein